jgi:PhoH-like ATPase
MKKNYVLDTNVLLHDPHAIFKFEDNDVIIPIFVIEEIDQFKREGTERGRNARTISRFLDELRESDNSLARGVRRSRAADTLRIAIPEQRPQLAVGSRPRPSRSGPPADGHRVRDHRSRQADDLRHHGHQPAHPRGRPRRLLRDVREPARRGSRPSSSRSIIDAGRAQRSTRSSRRLDAAPRARALRERGVCCATTARRTPRSAATTGRRGRSVSAARVARGACSGIRPRNREQSFALDVLLDDSIRLVTLLGKAGTGKTLLALAAGLKKHHRGGTYKRLLVSRPIMPLGRDIGFLPGDVDEKLNPWMQPIFDNLEFLSRAVAEGKRRGRGASSSCSRAARCRSSRSPTSAAAACRTST